MKPVAAHDLGAVRRHYAGFTDVGAPGSSAILHGWSTGVAQDEWLLQRLISLPPLKRQPNLLFAAARWHGVGDPDVQAWLSGVAEHWDAISATMLARSTQTNEVGRCAVLTPVLGLLEGPVALIEVGAAAGLTLCPDRYSYRWRRDDGSVTTLDPSPGPSSVRLECRVHADPPLPTRMPDVVWRAGIDLNPLDVTDDDSVQWLQTLVWPEHHDRRARLRAAVAMARADPPELVRGDLNDEIAALVARVPDGVTPVVFHSAVLAYLDEDERTRFTATVRDLPGHWVSNEGHGVLPEVTATAAGDPAGIAGAEFTVALDGRALGFAHGHGGELWWL